MTVPTPWQHRVSLKSDLRHHSRSRLDDVVYPSSPHPVTCGVAQKLALLALRSSFILGNPKFAGNIGSAMNGRKRSGKPMTRFTPSRDLINVRTRTSTISISLMCAPDTDLPSWLIPIINRKNQKVVRCAYRHHHQHSASSSVITSSSSSSSAIRSSLVVIIIIIDQIFIGYHHQRSDHHWSSSSSSSSSVI